MFPEYRTLISRLKQEDHHFAKLFERHNSLDQTIRNLESGIQSATDEEIEILKKEKLALKDSLYALLRKADA